MAELLQAFILGNGAILTNVCVLPLYPGLVAFLAGNAQNERAQRATRWLGLLVLAGVLTLMTVVGLVLFLLQQTIGVLLPVVLPVIYGTVIILGLLMLAGRNPFARMATSQAPVLRNPFSGAYLYGLFLGPMTLPCTGPLIISAFLLGAGNPSSLVEGLFYFFSFGLGFGWPLVALPFLAAPFQRRFTRWMTRRHLLLTRVSGALLVIIGLAGILIDFRLVV